MKNNSIGKVVKLFISENKSKCRIEKNDLFVDIKGVIGDKFYDKNIERSVLLASLDSYKKVRNEDILITYGELGENLLLTCNPHELAIGTKLGIGTSVLEISQKCTICNHLKSIDNSVPTLLKDDRGIFAKVLADGKMNIDDSIFIL